MVDDTVAVHNNCTLAAIDPAYHALIEDAIAAYRAVFAGRIEEVRLMGSVARGEAIAGLSDIDFMAITGDEPSDADCAALDQHAAALGRRYPIVSLVDLAACRQGDLHPAQHFILTSDSLAVDRTDRLTLREQSIHRETLITLVTLPMTQIIAEYGAAVAQVEGDDTARLQFWSRIIGKDVLKSLRGAALRRGDGCERNIAAIAEQAVIYFPEYATTIALLYQCYRTPIADRATLLHALAEAARLPR